MGQSGSAAHGLGRGRASAGRDRDAIKRSVVASGQSGWRMISRMPATRCYGSRGRAATSRQRRSRRRGRRAVVANDHASRALRHEVLKFAAF